MRLSKDDQITMMQRAREYPGPLATWLESLVQAQREVGVNGTFDLESIPVSQQEARLVSNAKAYREGRTDREAHLESIGYKEMDVHQRRAIRKMGDAKIRIIQESDLIPQNTNCWLGTHEVEEWEDDSEDHFLWQVIGTWTSGKDLKKWGCEDCARALAKAHPEADFHAFN
jgi:hypothetical protein